MSNQRYISDALKQKKQKIKKIKFYTLLVGIVLCIAGIIYVIQMPFIQIANVQIFGNTFVNTEEINLKTEKILNSYTYWIFPNKNIFIFSKKELEKKLKENPAITKVIINKDFFNTLIINIEEEEKEMLYCVSETKEECFYVNGESFIYAKVDEYIIPEQEIIIYSEKEQKTIKSNILQEDVYKEMVLFVKNIARYDIKIKEIYIKKDDTIEFVSKRGARVIASQFDDFEKDFENMVALFEQNILSKEDLMTVEYIDLRFGNKVFYKNKTN